MGKEISLIVATDLNLGIGFDNKLLWHLPDDFKWFKKNTMNKSVVMGRNTMISIGRALPNRQNIVVSSQNTELLPGFEYANNLDAAIEMSNTNEVMIIGGASIYKQMMPMSHRIYLTTVHHQFPEVDVFFPEIQSSAWNEVFCQYHPKDEKHAYSFDFKLLEKR